MCGSLSTHQTQGCNGPLMFVVCSYVEFRYDLGDGPAILRSSSRLISGSNYHIMAKSEFLVDLSPTLFRFKLSILKNVIVKG